MSHDQPRHSSLPVTHCLTSLSFYLVPLLLSLGYNDCLAFPQISQTRQAFAIAILTIWDALSYSVHMAGSLTPFKPLLKISPDEKGPPKPPYMQYFFQNSPPYPVSFRFIALILTRYIVLIHMQMIHSANPDARLVGGIVSALISRPYLLPLVSLVIQFYKSSNHHQFTQMVSTPVLSFSSRQGELTEAPSFRLCVLTQSHLVCGTFNFYYQSQNCQQSLRVSSFGTSKSHLLLCISFPFMIWKLYILSLRVVLTFQFLLLCFN